MTRQQELADPNSCFNKAADDELLFVVRAHDITSPGTVRDWVQRRLKAGKNQLEDRQIQDALNWAALVDKIHRESAGT